MSRSLKISTLGVYCVLHLIIVMGCEKRIDSNIGKPQFIFDDALMLTESQGINLYNYADSINNRKGIRLVFYSTLNPDQLLNIDSLAERQFKKLALGDTGALIFVSLSTRSTKILVGSKPHQYLTNSDLSKITQGLLPYFKNQLYYEGLRSGFAQLSAPIK